MKKLIIFVSIFFLLSGTRSFAQIIGYNLQKAVLSPVFLSDVEHYGIDLITSNSLFGFEGSPMRFDFTFGYAFRKNSSMANDLYEPRNYIGFTSYYEQYGVHKNLDVQIGYAYKILLSKTWRMSFGLSAGYKYLSSNYANIATDNNAYLANQSTKLHTYDFKAGISVSNKIFTSAVMIDNTDKYSLLLQYRYKKYKENDEIFYFNAEEKKRYFQLELTSLTTYNRTLKRIEQSATVMLGSKVIGFGIGWSYPTSVMALLNMNFSKFRLYYGCRLFDISKLNPAVAYGLKHEIGIGYGL